MPSSLLTLAMQGSPIQLSYPASYRPEMPLISIWSPHACRDELSGLGATAAPTSGAYTGANVVSAFPFQVGVPFPVRKVWWLNGTTASTNSADVAVYSADGATRIAAGGGATIAGANAVQEIDVATDVLLPPGSYWCTYCQDGTTATPLQLNVSLGGTTQRLLGLAQMAGGAVPLGTSFTPAVATFTSIPIFGIASRTQVA